MTILSIIQQAARRCGLTPPAVVMGSGDETWLQMVEWAQEAIDDACERHDWRALHKRSTITGDGSTTQFALPTDYARQAKQMALTRDGAVGIFDPIGPVGPPSWIRAQTSLVGSVTPIYQIENGYLSIYTAPATGETFTFSYQSSKPCYSTSGGSPGPITRWTNDTDTGLIPERLIMLGTVARWKWAKGFDGTKFEDDYERALERLASADWGLIAQDTSYGDLESLADPVSEPYVNT